MVTQQLSTLIESGEWEESTYECEKSSRFQEFVGNALCSQRRLYTTINESRLCAS